MDIDSLLGSNERLLDIGRYAEPPIGDRRWLERTTLPPTRNMLRYWQKHGRPPPPRDGSIVGFDLLSFELGLNNDRIARFWGGLNGKGYSDSMAGSMWRAVATAPGEPYYMVTDQRFLVVMKKSEDDEFEVAFFLPRSEITAARRRGRPLQRGRVELWFKDRSMIALGTGVFRTHRAQSLVRALSWSTRKAPG